MAVRVVTSSGDVTNASDGVLTLREAIAQSNAAAGDDTITFAQAVRTVRLTQGELVVNNTAGSDTGKLTIDGDFNDDAKADIVIQRDGYAASRILHLQGDGDGDNQFVALEGLNISRGRLESGNGAGLLAENAILMISNSSISGNSISVNNEQSIDYYKGAGIAVFGGDLTLENTKVNNNALDINEYNNDYSVAGRGGGLYATVDHFILSSSEISYNSVVSSDWRSSSGAGAFVVASEISVSDTSIVSNNLDSTYGNYGNGYGGGMNLEGQTIDITNTDVILNNMGGIVTKSTSTSVSDTVISDNHLTGLSDVSDTLLVDRAIISGNTQSGIRQTGGSFILSNSVLSDNSSYGYSGGGGLNLSRSATIVKNTTIDSNISSRYFNEGIGGGIYAKYGSLELVNSTLSNNTARYYSSYAQGEGGGIAARYLIPTIRNSIIAGNIGTGSSRDISGTITSNGHNLFGQSVVSGSTSTDLKGITDPKLGPLAGNGGPTQTLALLLGSLAIDAGLDSDAAGLTTDQRGTGFARISGSHVDIGAFELQQAALPPLFTAGNDTVNLGSYNLTLYPGTLATDALAGNDTVTLSATQNVGVAFHGGTGNDTLFGTSSVDRLYGDDGDDTFRGLPGSDFFYGGAGTDTASFEGGTSSVVASLTSNSAATLGFTDTLSSIESLTGGSAADTLTGSTGINRLTGADGNDVLNGGGANDVLDGGAGIDTVTYATLATGGVTANLTTNVATSADGTDTFLFVENLTGSNGGDVLVGSTGANLINGGAGNDTLTGGGGKDTLTSGTGNDKFIYNLASDSTLGANRDVLTDFTHGTTATTGDKINVSAIDANSTVAGNQAFVWKGAGALTGAAQAHYVTIGGVHLIQFSTDGDAAAEFEIQIPTAFTPVGTGAGSDLIL